MPALYHSPVTRTERLSDSVYRLSLHAPALAGQVLPGQFVNIRVSTGYEPLWRRPFSVHAVDRRAGEVQLLYEVVGTGTRMLAGKVPGDILNILGPLGNSFTYPEPGVDAMLVAGGLGIAPLYFLARELLSRGTVVKIVLGARTAEHLLCVTGLSEAGAELHLATDDGSQGFRGLATELLLTLLHDCEAARLYACGPTSMLRALAVICRDRTLSAQASLETVMACGFGACMGCAVEASAGGGRYHLTCVDGPVFDLSEVHFGD